MKMLIERLLGFVLEISRVYVALNGIFCALKPHFDVESII